MPGLGTFPPLAVEARELAVNRGGRPVLSGVSFRAESGSLTAVIGPNGAGKSTLFDLISGRTKLTSGEIRLEAERIDGLPPEAICERGLSRSFQITSIFGRMSVYENLRVAVQSRQRRRYTFWRTAASLRSVREETEALMETVRLQNRRETPAGLLPYSEQRALELGLTLSMQPKLILLDEPTAGMSREETNYTVDLVRTLTEGRTLLVVEHDMDVVFGLCDRISVLVHGRVLASGPSREIAADRSVKEAYLGEQAA